MNLDLSMSYYNVLFDDYRNHVLVTVNWKVSLRPTLQNRKVLLLLG